MLTISLYIPLEWYHTFWREDCKWLLTDLKSGAMQLVFFFASENSCCAHLPKEKLSQDGKQFHDEQY